MALANQHQQFTESTLPIKNNFFIEKFGVVLKVCVEHNKQVTIGLQYWEPERKDFALRLAGIQMSFAQSIIRSFNGFYYAQLLIAFDERKWQVFQADVWE